MGIVLDYKEIKIINSREIFNIEVNILLRNS
jgi:hypothetical protein